MSTLIKRNKKLNNRKGFTLIELIVVIAILGILAAVLVPQLGGFTDKAKQAQVLSDAAALATAADAILVEKGSVSSTDNTAIASLAGITLTSSTTLNVTATTLIGGASTPVPFTYQTTVKNKSFAATRNSTGEIAIN